MELHFKDHQVPRVLGDYKEVQALLAQKGFQAPLELLAQMDPTGPKALKDSMDHEALKGMWDHPAQKVPKALLA